MGSIASVDKADSTVLNPRHYPHDLQSQGEDITYKSLELSLGPGYTQNYQSRKILKKISMYNRSTNKVISMFASFQNTSSQFGHQYEIPMLSVNDSVLTKHN